MLWKLIKIIFKSIGVGLGVIALLVVSYIIYNTPFASKYKTLSGAELQVYLDYLDAHISDPLQFVSKKFERYDVVLVGEMHRRRQDVKFVKSLIPYLYEKNGVTVVGWEFGASDFQSEVDSLVNAAEFDEKKAISLMRRYSYFWNFQEYLDIYRVIWELNKKIPAGKEKIRFLQLGSDYNERKLRSPDPRVRMQENKRYFYDKKMADIIEREALLKGKKALWYSGLHHAFSKYRQPTFFFRFLSGEDRRGGNFLYDKYPDRLYLIVLHMPVMGRWALLAEVIPSGQKFFLRFYYPFSSVIDKVYERHKRPFAFDTRISPFGVLEDNYSYYSFDYWGPIKLKDFCDGYIVPCSFKEAEPVSPIKDWVTTEAELEEVKERMTPDRAAQLKNIADFLKILEEDISRTVHSIHDVDRKGY
ncbi:MAG: ChaN family lipoprotein [Acidobacteriota bacterium]